MANKYLTIDPLGEATSTRRYKIREKMFSLSENYKIKDESDQPVFNVRSKFSLSDNLLLEDMAGNGLIKIREELLHLHTTYKILSARDGENNRELAVVKQKLSFHEKWSINSIYGEYKLEAVDLLARSLTLTKEGRTVAIVSRKYFTMGDNYGVEIDDGENQPFIIALVIVINQALYSNYNVHPIIVT